MREGTDALLARIGPVFASANGWANQLRAFAYVMRDFFREDPDRAHLMVIEVLDSTPEAIAVREEGVAALTALLDRGRSELEDPDSVPSTVAEITSGVLYNRIHVAVVRGESLDDELVQELMFTAVLPYLGIEAALAELDAPGPRGRS